MVRKSFMVVSAVVVASLGFAACGSDDSGSSSGSGAGSGAGVSDAAPPVALNGKVTNHGNGEVKDGAVDMEVDDFYFAPTFVKAPAGSTVKVELESEGSSTHTFTIDGTPVDVTLKKGDKKTVDVAVPASGALNFYCRFHRSSGMQGAIYSKEGDAIATAGAAPPATTPTTMPSGSSGAYGNY